LCFINNHYFFCVRNVDAVGSDLTVLVFILEGLVGFFGCFACWRFLLGSGGLGAVTGD
jgi:hypothetical protein